MNVTLGSSGEIPQRLQDKLKRRRRRVWPFNRATAGDSKQRKQGQETQRPESLVVLPEPLNQASLLAPFPFNSHYILLLGPTPVGLQLITTTISNCNDFGKCDVMCKWALNVSIHQKYFSCASQDAVSLCVTLQESPVLPAARTSIAAAWGTSHCFFGSSFDPNTRTFFPLSEFAFFFSH